jgi:hypothetical protein
MDMTRISYKEYNCGRCGKNNRKSFIQIMRKYHAYFLKILRKHFDKYSKFLTYINSNCQVNALNTILLLAPRPEIRKTAILVLSKEGNIRKRDGSSGTM